MNRNVESHFSQTPQVEMPRSTFDRSSTHQTTFNVGDLIPFYVDEVYPGDTFKVTTNKVIRLQTLLNPLMDTLYADTYYFFVPNRIVDDNWSGVMGENLTGAWAPSTSYSTPVIGVNSTDQKILSGTIEDYMGIPVGINSLEFNALPIRGYHLIWNDFFRDENLQAPLNIYKGDAKKYLNAGSATDDLSEKYPWPRKAARYHDYFSSCLPTPSKGPDVLIPFSGQLPVVTTTTDHGQTTPVGMLLMDKNNAIRYPYLSTASPSAVDVYSTAQTSRNFYYPTNLWATTLETGIGTSGLSATINDLREAFAIQRLYERDAIGGSRYIELLKSHFGVTSPDARLQRPEYLGGNRIALNVHQVVNNSESSSYALGNLGAMSHTVDMHEDFVKSFVEHGFVIGLIVVRYQNTYAQGMERFWSRTDRFSYYWPAMSRLGNQAVKNKEIYAQGTSADNQVFGYQEAWAELRYKPNRVSGEMRPGITGSLATWNLADYYTSQPYLSAGWIESNKDIVDRTLAVQSSTSNQVLADIYVKNIATRVLPMYSIPGLIDHF